MAYDRTGRASIILIGLLCSVALAIPQSFGPLIRDRAIQTSEERLNANIDRIYRKDFKTLVRDASDDAMNPTPTDLVTRANPAMGVRTRKPIDNTDPKGNLTVVRGPDGMLYPVFSSPTPKPIQQTAFEHVVSKTDGAPDRLLVLRASPMNGNGTDEMERFEKGSYPDGYPFEKIARILAQQSMYREVFDESIKLETLVTRIDSPRDKAVCSSTEKFEYPTYSPKHGWDIVNVPGYHQSVRTELCDNVGGTCSNASTDSDHQLVCQQMYGEFDVYVVPLDDRNGFERKKLRMPSCCQCVHEPKPRLTRRP